MKRIIKFTGLLTLILFSFFYTDKVVEVIRENDKLMIELEQVSDNYKVNAINGIISGDTIKPGINGKKVNIEKSYKQMKEKDGDSYLLYGKDQTPAGCGARQENKETEHLQKTQSR